MRKPWVIGLLSIVPGLGFIVLGEVGRGFFVMALVAFFALGVLFAPWETVKTWSLVLGFCAWCAQIFYAWYYAVAAEQRIADQEAGLALPEPPPGASLGERRLLEARQSMTRLLQPGECLHVALQGQVGTPPLLWVATKAALGDYSSEVSPVYLGVTEQDFVLLSPDPTGKPAGLRRIPLGQARLVQASEGLLLDEVAIDIGEPRPLRVQLPRWIRPETRRLVRILSGKESVLPDAWKTVQRGLDHESGRPMPAISAPAEQGHRSKHPVLVSTWLGAGGGIAGAIAGAVLIFIAGMIDCSVPDRGIDCGEGWGYLIGFYCLAMFPVGGAALGAIPGVLVGVLQISKSRSLTLRPPFLAGFVVVVALTLVGLGVIFASYLA